MSRQTPNGPMPRMTDSQAGPGAPSSLKFAALSVQSYQLDSPPFTGAAVGAGGPLDEAGRHLADHGPHRDSSSSSMSSSASSSSSAAAAAAGGNSTSHDPSHTSRSGRDGRRKGSSPLVKSTPISTLTEDQDPYTRSLSHHRTLSNSEKAQESNNHPKTPTAESSSRHPTRSSDPSTRSSTSSSNPHQRSDSVSNSHQDRDVPQWDLDDSLSSREHSSASLATLMPAKSVLGMTSTSDHPAAQPSRADDARSNAPTRVDSSTHPTGSLRHKQSLDRDFSIEGREEAVDDRPSYSQFTEDLDAQEDAGSSAAEKDDEVDGDEGLSFNRDGGARLNSMRVPRQGQSKEEYRFPRHRLPTKMRDEARTPLVIVACGSFSPPTYLHLRIFEMAKDQVIESGKYELLAGYYSPVSDYYKKEGLAKATHRVRMCELAVEKTSTWLMVDAWESLQGEYQRTAVVLDHFNEEINGGPNGGVQLSDGSRRRVKIMLLAGGDLIQSMGEPGIWATVDLHHILGQYGCLIVERTGADVWSFLLSHDLLWKYRRNLKIVKQTIYNDISSSKVRLFVRRGQSIKYLLPNSVIQYIEKEGLYRLPPDEDVKSEPEDTNW